MHAKVTVELYTGETQNWEGVDSVIDGKDFVSIYRDGNLLAYLEKDNLKNLLTEEQDTENLGTV